MPQGSEHGQCQCQGAAVEEPRTCADTSGVTVLEDPYNCQVHHPTPSHSYLIHSKTPMNI